MTAMMIMIIWITVKVMIIARANILVIIIINLLRFLSRIYAYMQHGHKSVRHAQYLTDS